MPVNAVFPRENAMDRDIPGAGPTSLLAEADRLVPLLAAGAAAADRDRRLPDATVRALADAGLFRAAAPVAFGGGGHGPEVLAQVVKRLARGCGSAAWLTAVAGMHAWLLGRAPASLARDALDPERGPLVAAAFGAGGTATRVADGYQVQGRWRYLTGILHAGWAWVVVRLVPPPEPPAEALAFVLVPTSTLRLEDGWHTLGMRGTASQDVSLQGAVVPEHHVVPYGSVLGEAPGDPLPPRTVFACVIAAPAIGLARGACGAYGALLRKMARERDEVRDTALVRLAEAAADVDAAEALLDRCLGELADRSAAGAPMPAADRARLRMRAIRAVHLCKSVTARVLEACGTRGHHDDAPPQRAARDVAMLASHAALDADAAAHAAGLAEAGFQLPEGAAV